MDREIWFEKVLWSYVPCHWKGIAAMFGVILPTVIAIILTQRMLEAIGYGDVADWLFIPILLSGIIALLTIAKRHSRPR